MTFRFKTREVLLFILISLGVYMVFIFGFVWIYYKTASIEMTACRFTPLALATFTRLRNWAARW